MSINNHKNDIPKFSVVITNYNYAEYVCDSVKSVISQRRDNIEVIVIDDGSVDDSLLRLKSLFYDNVTIIEQQNQGQSAALNLAVSKAKGDYIFFLDSDDLFFNEKLNIYEYVIEMCGSDYSLMYDDFIPIGPSGRVCKRLPTFVEKIWSTVDTSVDFQNNGGRPQYFPPTSTIMMPRASALLVFPLDTSIRISSDGLLVSRAALIGKFVHVNRTLTKYRVHESNNRGLWASSLQLLEKCINDFVLIANDKARYASKYDIYSVSNLYQCKAYVDLNAKKDFLSDGKLNPVTKAALMRLPLGRRLIYKIFDISPSIFSKKLFSITYKCWGKVKYIRCK